MNLFTYTDYKEFIHRQFSGQRGQFRKLALHLSVQTSLISQIFSGERHLTPEQACLTADYFKMDKIETAFFVNLVQLERAGSESLKEIIKDELKRLKKSARLEQPIEAVRSREILTEEEQAVFYSHWFYSAIRISTSIEGLQTAEEVSEHLGLPLNLVNKVIAFLLRAELCTEENGKIRMAVKATRVEAGSLFSDRLHVNWRMKGIEHIPHMDRVEDFFTTRVVSLSKADFNHVRKVLQKTLEDIDKRVDPSKPETLACLNIDWFKF